MLKHPMKKPGIAINSARCMACYACFMACKDEHCGWDTDLSKSQPEMGQYWMNIKEWERGDNERHIKTATVPTPCSHCDNPACMAAAKDGAVYKRPDGIVIVDPEKSKGQKQIVGGTSLTVYPAAGLIRYYRGKKLVLINRDETPYDREADLVIRDPIGAVFAQI